MRNDLFPLSLTGGAVVWAVGLMAGWLLSLGWRHWRRSASDSRTQALESKMRQLQEDAARLGGRYQLLESSHQALQNDLSQERSVAVSLHAELARERSLRVNLELALETLRRDRATPPAASLVLPAPAPPSRPLSPSPQPEMGADPRGAQPGASRASQDLQALLDPINVELAAVRKELATQRKTDAKALHSLHGQLARLRAAAAGTPEVQSGIETQLQKSPQASPAKSPLQPPSKELENFLRRIQTTKETLEQSGSTVEGG